MAIGQTSTEVMATSPRKRGVSAYSSAPAKRAHGVPSPRAPASRHSPRKAVARTTVHQSRWTIHAGTPAAGEQPMERPDGEQVAVGLVLQLTERALRVPHVQGAGEEA